MEWIVAKDLTEFDSLQERIHNLMIENVTKYNADRWADSDTQDADGNYLIPFPLDSTMSDKVRDTEISTKTVDISSVIKR